MSPIEAIDSVAVTGVLFQVASDERLHRMLPLDSGCRQTSGEVRRGKPGDRANETARSVSRLFVV